MAGNSWKRRLRRVSGHWETLARTDPFWAVLSDPEKRGNRWDADEFFRTGRVEVDAVLAYVAALGLELRRREALDFGCGVGRLTQALADHFDRVNGVDVSASMIDLAREHNGHGAACEYRVCEGPELPYADGSLDLVYSNLTLQHIPPRPARRYILELVRVLAPGGVAVFQQAGDPIRSQGPTNAWGRLRRGIGAALPRSLSDGLRGLRHALTATESFEMHGVPRPTVERLIHKAGGRLVAVSENRSAGEGWTSYRYCVTR